MTNSDKLIAECKRRAKKIKRDYPDQGLCQRMDIAAREMGYRHYRDLQTSRHVDNDPMEHIND